MVQKRLFPLPRRILSDEEKLIQKKERLAHQAYKRRKAAGFPGE